MKATDKMMANRSKHTEEFYKDLAALENYLQTQLQPVHPNTEFVSSLHTHLLGGEISIEPAALVSRKVFFTVAGLVSSILLLIGGVRATMKMIEAIKGTRQVRHKPVAPLA